MMRRAICSLTSALIRWHGSGLFFVMTVPKLLPLQHGTVVVIEPVVA